jgi:hypothetical protein
VGCSPKDGNGGGVAAKSDVFGGASVSRRKQEVEEVGVGVFSSLDGRKLMRGRKGGDGDARRFLKRSR